MQLMLLASNGYIIVKMEALVNTPDEKISGIVSGLKQNAAGIRLYNRRGSTLRSLVHAGGKKPCMQRENEV